MKEYRLTDWLPTTKKEVELRGWTELDVILFSADAYVDHPSFGAAVIGRILEAEGLKIAIDVYKRQGLGYSTPGTRFRKSMLCMWCQQSRYRRIPACI